MTRRARWTAVLVALAVGVLAVVAVGQGWIPDPSASGTSTPGAVASRPATAPPESGSAGEDSGSADGQSADAVRTAFEEQRSGVEVEGTGIVSRILPDDDEGSRHQKFILTTPGGVSILVAHNIDLAPRLDGLSKGDRVDFLGDYEWSDKGGTVHWTHHDPSGQHQSGWLRWNGHTFS